ncbi:MAG: nucleotidyltransferase domain-containing protein [Methanomicrobiales archaeon]|nr:nucleotidyltransferase domain-containing protein [Methanomicrobiales archaeon]
MLREFEKFVGFRVLAWFLTHPTGEIHINKLAREIAVSPGSVKSYADAFERDGLLTATRLGTARLLSLDNDAFAARELKRACMALLLVRAGIEELAPESIAIAVYGSTASGTFDEQSDIDILIIGDENQVDHGRVPALEAETGREVQVTVVPYYRWERMKEEGDPFVASVLENHMLVTGVPL